MWFKNLRQFVAAKNAQAFAIGAVILIMIAVTAITIYLSINAPLETKECEFQHSIEVTDDFIALNSTINLLHDTINSRILKYKNEQPESSKRHSAISRFVQAESLIESVPIKLKPSKESSIALPLASGTISFLADKSEISVRLTEEVAARYNNTTGIDNFNSSKNFSHVLEPGWNGDVNVTTSGNITLDGPPYVSACIVSNMTNSTNSTGFDTGSNSTVYDNITWYVENITAEASIALKVRTDMFPNMKNATKWYNCYAIESEEGRNSFPLPDLCTVSKGHRYVQFRAELKTENPQKTPKLINVSISYSRENVILANASGIIQYKSSYYYLPDQVITYQNGAVIKSQDDGGLVCGPFNISFLNVTNNRTRIDISLVNLTGENVSGIAGESTLVRLRLLDHKLISDSLFYPNLTLTVNSSNADTIGRWFNDTLKNLTSPQDYTVNTSMRQVEIELYAKEHGIELYLEEATYDVKM